MGLIKSGIKYGGLIYAVNVISKGASAQQESKTATPLMRETLQQSQQSPAHHSEGPQPDNAGYLHRANTKAIAVMNAMESRIGGKSEQIIIGKCLPFGQEESLERAVDTSREVVIKA